MTLRINHVATEKLGIPATIWQRIVDCILEPVQLRIKEEVFKLPRGRVHCLSKVLGKRVFDALMTKLRRNIVFIMVHSICHIQMTLTLHMINATTIFQPKLIVRPVKFPHVLGVLKLWSRTVINRYHGRILIPVDPRGLHNWGKVDYGVVHQVGNALQGNLSIGNEPANVHAIRWIPAHLDRTPNAIVLVIVVNVVDAVVRPELDFFADNG